MVLIPVSPGKTWKIHGFYHVLPGKSMGFNGSFTWKIMNQYESMDGFFYIDGFSVENDISLSVS